MLKVKYYIRYCDDFVILSSSREEIEGLVSKIESFLKFKLKLSLHPEKIIIRKYTQGIDFLGYIILPYIILPRTKTKRRMLKKLAVKADELQNGTTSKISFNQSLASYLGFLRHSNSFKLSQHLEDLYFSGLFKSSEFLIKNLR